MESPLLSHAALKDFLHFLIMFFFFCVCEKHNVWGLHQSVAASKSMQVQMLNPLLSVSMLFSFVVCLLGWSSLDLTEVQPPRGSAETCLCLFVLHILKCLFVSLLEGQWEKRIGEVRWGIVGLAFVPLCFKPVLCHISGCEPQIK